MTTVLSESEFLFHFLLLQHHHLTKVSYAVLESVVIVAISKAVQRQSFVMRNLKPLRWNSKLCESPQAEKDGPCNIRNPSSLLALNLYCRRLNVTVHFPFVNPLCHLSILFRALTKEIIRYQYIWGVLRIF